MFSYILGKRRNFLLSFSYVAVTTYALLQYKVHVRNPQFADEEGEAQIGKVTCFKSLSGKKMHFSGKLYNLEDNCPGSLIFTFHCLWGTIQCFVSCR